MFAAILLHQHRVRAGRATFAGGHRRPGKDAYRNATPCRMAKGPTGRNTLAPRQPGFPVRVEVVKEHGPAIDRRIVMGRHIARRKNIARQYTAMRLEQTHLPRRGNDVSGLTKTRQGLSGRHQLAAKGKTIIG